MQTLYGRILIAMALLGALAGCAGMTGDGTAIAPTSPPVYNVNADL